MWEEVEEPIIGDEDRTTPEGNKAVHIALRYLKDHLKILMICEECPVDHLKHANAKNETPLHIAAMTRNLDAVNCIRRRVGVEEVKRMLRMADANGDTALHWALRNSHEDVACKLVEYFDTEVLPDSVNNKGESLLYLAASRSLSTRLADLLLGKNLENHGGPDNLTALHAAVIEGNSAWTDKLLTQREGIADIADAKGQTALHHAVIWGDLNMVTALLDHDGGKLGYKKDNDGNTAIALSARPRHSDPVIIRIFKMIFRRCPDSVDITNNKGMNVLHIGVDSENERIVNCICRSKVLQRLINQQDIDGNTPLHLSVLKGKFPGMSSRLLDLIADTKITNNEGLTAAQLFKSRLMPRWSPHTKFFDVFLNHYWTKDDSRKRKITRIVDISDTDELSDEELSKYAKNASLVAILMVTVTFAAAFTIPGGYTNEGEVVLGRSAALKVFLIANTYSMCTSLAVAYIYSFAVTRGKLFLRYYAFAVRYLMEHAFAGMMVAFATGSYAVVTPKCKWLGILICVFCCAICYVTIGISLTVDTYTFALRDPLSAIVRAMKAKRTVASSRASARTELLMNQPIGP